MKRWLVDTGPFVAYLDRRDPEHEAVAECLDAFAGQLLTTGAVITEVMYFVSDSAHGPTSFVEFLARANVQVVAAFDHAAVSAAVQLMKKYGDTPMDFADATLVLLADRSGLLDVLTLDRRGFSTYRTARGKRFRLALDV